MKQVVRCLFTFFDLYVPYMVALPSGEVLVHVTARSGTRTQRWSHLGAVTTG